MIKMLPLFPVVEPRSDRKCYNIVYRFSLTEGTRGIPAMRFALLALALRVPISRKWGLSRKSWKVFAPVAES